MILRWFLSKSVREAMTVHKHYRRLLAAQRDLLSPEAIGAVQAALGTLKETITSGANKGAIRIKAEELQFAGEKWLKPYPNPGWRENVEVLLVALAVAMGIRTFFLQPFKIPTGSMQPTLFGVTSENYLAFDTHSKFKIPTGWERVKEWFKGTSYIDIVAESDGQIESISAPVGIKIFNFWQNFQLGGKTYTIWFPPDYGEAPSGVNPLAYRAGLEQGRHYRKGDSVIKLKMKAGDHLFVDRLTYNFRSPERGEIVVFATGGIPEEHRVNPPFWTIPPDQFYIKRLVGLGGEKIQIGADRHLLINGKRLDAGTPHFENVYSFAPKSGAESSKFSGHVSQPQMPFFPDSSAIYQIPAGQVMVMGDNTLNSLDSRYWGDFPQSSIIGKAWFVYWPLSERFGWGTR